MKTQTVKSAPKVRIEEDFDTVDSVKETYQFGEALLTDYVDVEEQIAALNLIRQELRAQMQTHAEVNGKHVGSLGTFDSSTTSSFDKNSAINEMSQRSYERCHRPDVDPALVKKNFPNIYRRNLRVNNTVRVSLSK